MAATTTQGSLSLKYPSAASETALTEFSLFPKLPLELSAMIWKAAMAVDFSSKPFSMKTYSDAFGEKRAPPKTASINQESRGETLAVFRRLEIHKEEWWKGVTDEPPASDCRYEAPRIYNPTRVVFWNKSTDVLALDVSTVYLGYSLCHVVMKQLSRSVKGYYQITASIRFSGQSVLGKC